MDKRLEKCWCGGIALLTKDNKGNFARCTHCGNSDFLRHKTEEVAVASWNEEMERMRMP